MKIVDEGAGNYRQRRMRVRANNIVSILVGVIVVIVLIYILLRLL